jgi:hypothetical protein
MPSVPMTAANEFRKVVRGLTPTHVHLRDRLLAVATFTLIVDAIATLVIFLLEHHAPGTKIHTLGDSAFWTSTQLLTVSSQLPNPISTGGRIVDVFLQIYAISVVATLAGSFGAFFNRRGFERDPPKMPHEASPR